MQTYQTAVFYMGCPIKSKFYEIKGIMSYMQIKLNFHIYMLNDCGHICGINEFKFKISNNLK